MSDSIKLIENFITFQGEGVDCGKRMLLLRFKNCNLKCPWCDTTLKMRIYQEGVYYINDIQATLRTEKVGLLITGGEPTFTPNYDSTVRLLNILEYSFANVETNGIRLLDLQKDVTKENVKFIYSPKLFSDKEVDKFVEIVKTLKDDKRLYLKMVVSSENHKSSIIKLINRIDFFDNEKIYLMPEGTTSENLLHNSQIVFDLCEQLKVNFSSRDHIIYGFI